MDTSVASPAQREWRGGLGGRIKMLSSGAPPAAKQDTATLLLAVCCLFHSTCPDCFNGWSSLVSPMFVCLDVNIGRAKTKKSPRAITHFKGTQ